MSDDPRGERWRRVEELYHAAVGLPASERTAFLRDACGDDAQLRQEVATLLSVAQDAEHFLEPTGATVVGSPTRIMTGSLVGSVPRLRGR